MSIGYCREFAIICVLCGLAATANCQAPTPSNPAAMTPPTAVTSETDATSINLSTVHWTPMVPAMGKDSPVIAILHEHPNSHIRQFAIRMPANFHVPAHFHTANETHTVIEGTFIIEANGKRVALTPGGFNYTPGGTVHEAWTLPDHGALIFVTVDGPYDLLQK